MLEGQSYRLAGRGARVVGSANGAIANVLWHISASTRSTRMGNLSASSVGIHGDGSKSNERGLSAQPAHSDAERAGRERSALPYDCARTQLE